MGREALQPAQPLPAALETYFATDWISASESWSPNDGMPPPPLVTWCTTGRHQA